MRNTKSQLSDFWKFSELNKNLYRRRFPHFSCRELAQRLSDDFNSLDEEAKVLAVAEFSEFNSESKTVRKLISHEPQLQIMALNVKSRAPIWLRTRFNFYSFSCSFCTWAILSSSHRYLVLFSSSSYNFIWSLKSLSRLVVTSTCLIFQSIMVCMFYTPLFFSLETMVLASSLLKLMVVWSICMTPFSMRLEPSSLKFWSRSRQLNYYFQLLKIYWKISLQCLLHDLHQLIFFRLSAKLIYPCSYAGLTA